MPRVAGEEELITLKECQYSYPVETQSDLQRVRSHFSDLRLYVDFYCFPNKEKKKLLYLAGTVPVQYEGGQYNIPVCIWLHETHPASRPRCYVCPSVSMVINTSCPCVDATGNVHLHALSNWTHGLSNLTLLVSEMRRAFQKDTPLYARSLGQAPPPAARSLGQAPPPAARSLGQAPPPAARSLGQAPPPAARSLGQAPPPAASSLQYPITSSSITSSSITSSITSSSITSSISSSITSSSISSSITSSSPQSQHGAHQVIGRSPSPFVPVSQWDLSREVRVRRSYTEELLGIDFSAPPPPSSSSSSSSSSSFNHNPFLRSASSGVPADPLSRMMGSLSLDPESSRDRGSSGSGSGVDRVQVRRSIGSDLAPPQALARLPPDRAAIFLSLLSLEGRSFSPDDIMEAVQLSTDLPSALRFLTHCCPLCQDQVSFSKIITMTHCSCFLCQTCFKTFFSTAIKEKSVDQLVCPQCGRPEVRGHGGMEESMDYFNLLDTQIRHFLPPQIHELFQRKLRDRALQEMPNFCWCAHCSFGMLHEADRLRMDCPSCKKSTCSQCRSPWSPQHQGLSCQQFRVWQQQNQPDQHSALLHQNSIECPRCQSIFSLSKGGCLHFTCSQCRHQFCGGCSRPFSPGSACRFSADCGSKGLHAHHPRDCLYHLRDWSVPRLHLLLQYYRVSPSWLEPAGGGSPDAGSPDAGSPDAGSPDAGSPDAGSGGCSVELRDDGREEPCGLPAPPEYRGYCQIHYKERLVELINRCRADPAVLFSPGEMVAELQRWLVAVPTRKPEEPEPLYAHRLRMTLTNSVPLRKQRRSPLKLHDDLCPLTSAVAAGAPPPHLLLSDSAP